MHSSVIAPAFFDGFDLRRARGTTLFFRATVLDDIMRASVEASESLVAGKAEGAVCRDRERGLVRLTPPARNSLQIAITPHNQSDTIFELRLHAPGQSCR
jgi:hypothetical protein